MATGGDSREKDIGVYGSSCGEGGDVLDGQAASESVAVVAAVRVVASRGREAVSLVNVEKEASWFTSEPAGLIPAPRVTGAAVRRGSCLRTKPRGTPLPPKTETRVDSALFEPTAATLDESPRTGISTTLRPLIAWPTATTEAPTIVKGEACAVSAPRVVRAGNPGKLSGGTVRGRLLPTLVGVSTVFPRALSRVTADLAEGTARSACALCQTVDCELQVILLLGLRPVGLPLLPQLIRREIDAEGGAGAEPVVNAVNEVRVVCSDAERRPNGQAERRLNEGVGADGELARVARGKRGSGVGRAEGDMCGAASTTTVGEGDAEGGAVGWWPSCSTPSNGLSASSPLCGATSGEPASLPVELSRASGGVPGTTYGAHITVGEIGGSAASTGVSFVLPLPPREEWESALVEWRAAKAMRCATAVREMRMGDLKDDESAERRAVLAPTGLPESDETEGDVRRKGEPRKERDARELVR